MIRLLEKVANRLYIRWRVIRWEEEHNDRIAGKNRFGDHFFIYSDGALNVDFPCPDRKCRGHYSRLLPPQSNG